MKKLSEISEDYKTFRKIEDLINKLESSISKKGFQKSASRRYAVAIVEMLPHDVIMDPALLKDEFADIGSILVDISKQI